MIYPDSVDDRRSNAPGFKERSGHLSNTQKRWLDVAAKAALNGTCRNLHAALVVSGGRVISIGVNKSQLQNDYRNWVEPGKPPSIHAEIAALKQCRGLDLSNATLYVARINRQGEKRMSRPCRDCQKWILENTNIRKICYTINHEMEL